jgi:hypothetical protein
MYQCNQSGGVVVKLSGATVLTSQFNQLIVLVILLVLFFFF